MQRLSQGSNIANINQDLLSHIKIPLVDIRFQESVVDFLNRKCTAIDTAIEQKQKLIEKLIAFKKSLIYECVTGKKEILKNEKNNSNSYLKLRSLYFSFFSRKYQFSYGYSKNRIHKC